MRKHYFGREICFLIYLLEFQNLMVPLEKKVLYKQMTYITMPITSNKIHHKLEQVCKLGKYQGTNHTHTLYTGAELMEK